jgi:chromosomal replication initiation ATPase DnaA
MIASRSDANLCDEDGMYLSLWKGLIWAPGREPWRVIAHQVAKAHAVTLADLRGPSRKRSVAWPRHELMWRLNKQRGLGVTKIGRLLGERDHSTVVKGIAAHERRTAERVA